MSRRGLAIGIILLFVGVTITPTINFNTVKASQQNVIKERINQRELLFQTIVDITNNKEIQRIILKSQMSRGIFPTSKLPVVTKTHIRQMYFLGLILSKVIGKSRIQSWIGKYQFNNQEMQKEVSDVIEKNSILNAELTQLKDSECVCEIDNTLVWHPVICTILFILTISLELPLSFHEILFDIGITFGQIEKMIIIGFAILFLAVYIFAVLISCNWAINLWPEP